MFAKPINSFEIPEQSLLTIPITFMDPSNRLHGPLSGSRAPGSQPQFYVRTQHSPLCIAGSK